MLRNIISNKELLDKEIMQDVPCSVHKRVLDTLNSLETTKTSNRRIAMRYKIVAVCLVVFCVSGLTVCAAEVIQEYKERMTEMNRQQLEEYYAAAMPSETIQYSRELTKEEEKRWEILKNAYQTEGCFPKGQVKYLEDASDYHGKGVALHAQTGILYLPDKELTDEEILQIIDFFRKIEYSIYELNQERIAAEKPWMERMQSMTDEEVDRAYITMYTGQTEISGRRSRKFFEEEERRYEELVAYYEEENWIPNGEIAVIEMPEEYTGETVAVCRHDSTFYLPDRALTDEEFLQIIDMNHKASYSISRIGDEIRMGFRTYYPGYPEE